VKFGSVPIKKAAGAVLAHSVRIGERSLRKGHVLSADDVKAMRAEGVLDVVVARRGIDDLDENEAARRIASSVVAKGIRADVANTGRVNLFADADGVLVLQEKGLNRLNAISEAITIATLPNYARVAHGDMVATVKIIPFAVPRRQIEKAAMAGAGCVAFHAFHPMRVAVVSTLVSTLKMSVIDKTLRIMDERLASLAGSTRIADIRIPHAPDELAEAIAHAAALSPDLIIVFGGSAISDRNDVIPAALVAAGGHVTHLGMPVDPGNLLMLGALGNCLVIGAPGCARSPRRNGFDFVLERISAGVPVGSADIRAMAVGGLLSEIETRPHPRAGEKAQAPVAAIVLAAGRGTRMGGGKMTALLGGKPLVRHAVEAALASSAGPVHVVVGAEREKVLAALVGLDVAIIDNPDFASGLSSSLKAGVASLPENAKGALVLLGDMPLVTSATIDALGAAFADAPSIAAVVPVRGGQRGNPILLAKRLFTKVASLQGDVGARAILADVASEVIEIAVDDDAVLVDIDTPEALRQAQGAKS
jgi:molybdenum cofactor cytidylyltransferase